MNVKQTTAQPEADIPSLDRATLQREITSLIHRGRTWWAPTLHETRLDGRPVVWKDLSDRPWPFRTIFGAVLRREARSMLSLAPLKSAPKVLGLVGRHGYVMEKLNADRLPHLKDNDLTIEYFDALLAELQAMHDLGVAHGDLRRKNILIDPSDRSPKLIDFGTAVVLGPNPGWMRRSLYRKVRRLDLLHYAKLKDHYAPGALNEEEQHWLSHAPWHYRLGRIYRTKIHRPLKWRNLRQTLRRLGFLRKKEDK